MQGIYTIYKPIGPTSHDVVNQLRRITGIKKIGHAGTLDPLASGILVVGIGRKYTRQLDQIVKKEKEYMTTIKLGEYSSTDDQEGEKEKIKIIKKPTQNEIKKTIVEFIGEIYQVPPRYSAIKIAGKKAYSLARKGKNPELKPRKILVKKIDLLQYKWPYLKIKVLTGPGVYIRSLARDIGKKLAVGGYLYSLERIRVGQFRLRKSLTIKEFKDAIK